MTEQPLISLITVTFNAADTISKTLESIQQQNYKDFEHLVIDGASGDNTLDIIKKYNLPQTIVVSEPDKGLYDAMNKGLRRAKGKYVLFLNAGDSFHSSETLARYADACTLNRDIIYGETDIVNDKGEKISDRHLSVPGILTKKSFLNGMLICHQAFMVKKSLAPEYDLAYRLSSDYDWTIKCIASSNPDNCMNLHEVTIDFLSDGMSDKNKWASLKERFIIMKRHYGLIPTIYKHISFIPRAIRRGKI